MSLERTITLIDAHGPDHGLRVVVNLRDRWTFGKTETTVEIVQWGESSEPDDRGSYSPHLHRVEVPLDKLLTGRHVDRDTGYKRSGVRERILSAATAYLGYYGGEEELLDEGDRPCQHFGMEWGRHQVSHRLGCEVCGEYSGGPCTCHPVREV